MSREFADNLCRMLAEMVLKYVKDVGIVVELAVNEKGLVLPGDFAFTVNDMGAVVCSTGEEVIVNL